MYYNNKVPTPLEVRFFELEHSRDRLAILEIAYELFDNILSQIDEGIKTMHELYRPEESSWENVKQDAIPGFDIDLFENLRYKIGDGIGKLNAIFRTEELTWERVAHDVNHELEKYGVNIFHRRPPTN
jgi:hypothetical protein